jgi:hypothetical protein
MRVFTPTQLYEKRIPKSSDFLSVHKDMKAGFEEVFLLQRETERTIPLRLCGAIVIGSLARQHDMACTSDIDIVTFYDDREANEGVVARFMKKYRERYTLAMVRAEKYNIPINVYNTFSSLLKAGATRHNKQFLKHAIFSMEGFGGKSESGLLAGNSEEVREIFQLAPSLGREGAKMYLDRKKEELRDGHSAWGGLSEEKTAKLFGQMFNSPFHAARQVLDVLGVEYEDTKPGVMREIAGIVPKAATSLQELALIASDYVKACEVFRDDATNKAPAPTLSFEQVYSEASCTLLSLRTIL